MVCLPGANVFVSVSLVARGAWRGVKESREESLNNALFSVLSVATLRTVTYILCYSGSLCVAEQHHETEHVSG